MACINNMVGLYGGVLGVSWNNGVVCINNGTGGCMGVRVAEVAG